MCFRVLFGFGVSDQLTCSSRAAGLAFTWVVADAVAAKGPVVWAACGGWNNVPVEQQGRVRRCGSLAHQNGGQEKEGNHRFQGILEGESASWDPAEVRREEKRRKSESAGLVEAKAAMKTNCG